MHMFMLVDEINDLLLKHPISKLSVEDDVELTRTVSAMLYEGLGRVPKFHLTANPYGHYELEVEGAE